MDTEEFTLPTQDDFHGKKRELLKRGISLGELKWEEIVDTLPPEFFNDSELEVFLFTCQNLGIKIRGISRS